MRKHLKKKFLHQVELTDEVKKITENSSLGLPIDRMKEIKKLPDGYTTFLMTEDNKFFKSFTFKHEGKLKFIPEPDPILVYFNAAYSNYKTLQTRREEILNILSKEKMTEVMINELYDYFGASSSFIILLFTSIEALINRCIKTDYQYKKITSRKTELYSKSQIENYFPFEEKIKTILPDATGKNFSEKFSNKYIHINNLKEFRDMIVHTKEATGESTYDYIYKKALIFKYEETINAVRDFCNFYTKDNFIEECDCSSDW